MVPSWTDWCLRGHAKVSVCLREGYRRGETVVRHTRRLRTRCVGGWAAHVVVLGGRVGQDDRVVERPRRRGDGVVDEDEEKDKEERPRRIRRTRSWGTVWCRGRAALNPKHGTRLARKRRTEVDRVDIVVKGRHTAVSERFRKHVQAKLTKLERLDSKVIRVDAELSEEHNPRLSGIRERIELTVYSRGPVIRAEAAAPDPYAALDLATSKLAERLRRAASRRNDHHTGNHRVISGVSPEAAGRPEPGASANAPTSPARTLNGTSNRDDTDGYDVPDRSPMVVREKTHAAVPLTLDEALSNMELVGHDFYLFQDAVTGQPSVVYRRCGYDYGVIRLETARAEAGDQVAGWGEHPSLASAGRTARR